MFSPFDHPDYRALVLAWMAEKPRQRSMRALARRLEKSHGWISMVCSRERDLPLDETGRWAKVLGLVGPEQDYFDALVREAHAPTLALRRAAAWDAIAIRALARASRDAARGDLVPLFGSVHAQILFELDRVGVPHAPEVFRPPAEPAELERAALAYSVAAGRRELASVDRIADPDLARGARALHQDTLRNGLRALVEEPPETCHFGSLVLALPASELPEISARIRDAVLAAVAPWMDAPADRVYQLAIQLVPRTGPLPSPEPVAGSGHGA